MRPRSDPAVMAGGKDRDYVYNDDLEAGCEHSWAPSGAFCDEHPDTHSRRERRTARTSAPRGTRSTTMTPTRS